MGFTIRFLESKVPMDFEGNKETNNLYYIVPIIVSFDDNSKVELEFTLSIPKKELNILIEKYNKETK